MYYLFFFFFCFPFPFNLLDFFFKKKKKIWVGPSSDEDLLTNSMEIAMEYVKTIPDGRSKETNCIYCVQAVCFNFFFFKEKTIIN